MRVLAPLLLAALAAADVAEETAAMLVSPDPERRDRAVARLAGQPRPLRDAVIGHLAAHGHDPDGWLADLQRSAPAAEGRERKRIERLVEHLSPPPRRALSIRLVLAETPEAPASTTVFANDAHLERVADGLRAPGTTIVLSREIVVTDRWTASAAALRKVSYVRDVDPNGSPEVASVKPGATVEVRPVLARDGTHATLHVEMRLVKLRRPMRVIEKKLGNGLRGRIQVPHLDETIVTRTVTVPLGGHAILSLPHSLVLVVRAGDRPTAVAFPPESR